MTKKEMIKTIQQKEAELFLEMKEYARLFGEESPQHKTKRMVWGEIFGLMHELNIKPDVFLPENLKAVDIVIEKVKEAAN